MIIHIYVLICISGLVSLYLAINSNTSQKRLLNGLVAMISNTVITYKGNNIELIKVIENSNGSLEADLITYSDSTITIFFLTMTLVSSIYVITGGYKKVAETSVKSDEF